MSHPVVQVERQSLSGRPRTVIPIGHIVYLLKIGLPVKTISRLLGVSRATLFRRLTENNLTVRGLYSSCTDEELDQLVSKVKEMMPHAGYRLIKEALKAQGYRLQWNRVQAAIQRVESVGIQSKTTQLGTNSVPCPKYLVHVDTNHKLIRYNIVIFAGIDVFSRKIMYLRAADNNRSDTTLSFFSQAVEKFGCPLTVQANHGGENVGVARLMFTVRGSDSNCFIADKSVHSHRLESLWRDLWIGVTSLFYHILHTLEEQDMLDLSSALQLFCCHFVFLPRLQANLDLFHERWDNHPLTTEQNLTPNQLWEIGQMKNPIAKSEEMTIPDIKREDRGSIEDKHTAINDPQFKGPISPEHMEQLRQQINPLQPSKYNGMDIYMSTVQFVQNLHSKK
ncbi:uncharacterized protein [Misgurnus anguillicaudatus]|uniref:uncharacterized protein n=1 Tax=Misgurnus anguillicaudatus TaxID=75329 RepID=UPI003CCF911C